MGYRTPLKLQIFHAKEKKEGGTLCHSMTKGAILGSDQYSINSINIEFNTERGFLLKDGF